MGRPPDQGPNGGRDLPHRAAALRKEVERLLDDLDALLDRLRRERQSPRPGERARELDEDREVGMQPDPGESPDAEP